MGALFRMIHSLLFWAGLTLSSALLFPVALLIWAVTSPFDRRRVALHQFTCFWGSLYTWFNPAWPVRIVNRHKLADTPSVMVANHLSFLDILVIFRLFNHFKWVSKVENFRAPFIGWNMTLNGYIPLRRGDRDSIVKMLASSERTLKEGSSIMMFPEGTRSSSGKLRPFKKGAFDLAKKTGSPIQPIVIRGTHRALPDRGFVLQGRHPIELVILDVISAESYAGLSVEELTDQVWNAIASELGADEVETPGSVELSRVPRPPAGIEISHGHA